MHRTESRPLALTYRASTSLFNSISYYCPPCLFHSRHTELPVIWGKKITSLFPTRRLYIFYYLYLNPRPPVVCTAISFSLFKLLFKYHLLREVFPSLYYHFFILPPSYLLSISPRHSSFVFISLTTI